jgi:hypothetical protein
MSNDKVFILSWDTPWDGNTVQGVFSDRALAEAKIVETALRGTALSNVKIAEHEVNHPADPTDPAQYSEITQALREGKKILAIKFLREKVPSLGLREAKEKVEALNISPEPQRYEHLHQLASWDVVVDDDEDKWIHIGGGLYVLKDRYTGLLPLRGEFDPLTEEEIRERHGIEDKYDF